MLFSLILVLLCVLHGTTASAPPLDFLLVTPANASWLLRGSQKLTISFNQAISQGPASKNITIFQQVFGLPPKMVYSTSVQSYDASPISNGNCQVVLTLPSSSYLWPLSNYTVRVDAGAYVASDGGDSLASDLWWSFYTVKSKPFDNSTIPAAPTHNTVVNSFLKQVNAKYLYNTVDQLSRFYNRFYQSATGVAARNWLKAQYKALVPSTRQVEIEDVEVRWAMAPFIVRVLGSAPTLSPVILGAHLDSINRENWTINVETGRAPGANDDGTGIALQLEFFRLLMSSPTFQNERTIEFHIYTAEEEGLYGSQVIADNYSIQKRSVRAMLQLDQCGYVHDRKAPIVAIFQDNTDKVLTNFITQLAKAYCPIPWVFSNEDVPTPGADSDFHSFSNRGYRAAYVAEGVRDSIMYGNDKHTAHDVIENVDFEHVIDVGTVAFSFLLELSLK